MIERHLPYFAAVAEEQHFQRAADRLGLTQSALSRRIQLLEQELGITLFERTARGAKLSAAGASLYDDVRRIRHELQLATDRARAVMRGDLGTIRVGINPSAASSPVAIRLLSLFRKRNPQVDVRVEVLYSDEQVNALHGKLLDFGLIYHFRSSPELEVVELARERLLLILPRDHPLATKPVLKACDLEEVPFVWPRRSQSPRLADWMIAACYRAGLTPKINMEVQSVDSVVNLIAVGMGVGFVWSHQLQQLPDVVIAREVEGLALEVPLCLAWRAGDQSPILPHLLAAAEDAREGAPPSGDASDPAEVGR